MLTEKCGGGFPVAVLLAGLGKIRNKGTVMQGASDKVKMNISHLFLVTCSTASDNHLCDPRPYS